jgi:hypothetical protein
MITGFSDFLFGRFPRVAPFVRSQAIPVMKPIERTKGFGMTGSNT